MLNGCPLLKMGKSKYDETRNVFYFGDSPELENLLHIYTLTKNKNRTKTKNMENQSNEETIYKRDNRKGLSTME